MLDRESRAECGSRTASGVLSWFRSPVQGQESCAGLGGVLCWVEGLVLDQGFHAGSGVPFWVGGVSWNSENSFIGSVDPKNLGVAFEFAFSSCLVIEL